MNDHEYAVRVERGGSATGDVVAVFPTLDQAREYIDDETNPWADCVLAIYTLEPCWEESMPA